MKFIASKLLTLVFLFGLFVNAQAAETCEQVFDLAAPAASQQAAPPKKGLFAKLFGRAKSASEASPAHLEAPRVLDPQTQIRVLQSQKKYQEATEKITALEKSLGSEQITLLQYIGEGQSGAMYAQFAGGTLGVAKGTRKFWQDPGAEVAAYQLNKFFNDFVLVPVTVLRTINGQKMSVQAHLSDASLSRVSEIPRIYKQKIRFFDYLIDNHDRRTANLLVDSQGFFAAIDNGIGFRTKLASEPGAEKLWTNISAETSWSLVLRGFSKDGGKTIEKEGVKLFIINSLPPRWVYDKLVSTPNEVFENLLRPYVSKEDVDAFIKRKDFLIQTAEEWLQKGNVYPVF